MNIEKENFGRLKGVMEVTVKYAQQAATYTGTVKTGYKIEYINNKKEL